MVLCELASESSLRYFSGNTENENILYFYIYINTEFLIIIKKNILRVISCCFHLCLNLRKKSD